MVFRHLIGIYSNSCMIGSDFCQFLTLNNNITTILITKIGKQNHPFECSITDWFPRLIIKYSHAAPSFYIFRHKSPQSIQIIYQCISHLCWLAELYTVSYSLSLSFACDAKPTIVINFLVSNIFFHCSA